MKTYSFHEYMNAKNSKIPAPIIKADGDTVKASPNPPRYGKTATKTCKSKSSVKSDKGFADMGDKDLEYKPKVESPLGKTPAKLPTAEAIRTANSIVNEMLANPAIVEQLVKQMNKKGLLGVLVAEVFEQKESAKHLAGILAHENYGPRICRNINKAINEEVAPPFSAQLSDQDKEQSFDNSNEDDPDEESELGDENHDDLDVDMDPNMGGDPSQMGMDPNMMDPSMGGDPSQMGIDPNMMDPSMGGDPSQMGMDPNMMDPSQMQPQQPMPLTMQKFQRAMMRAYQKAMMGKN